MVLEEKKQEKKKKKQKKKNKRTQRAKEGTATEAGQDEPMDVDGGPAPTDPSAKGKHLALGSDVEATSANGDDTRDRAPGLAPTNDDDDPAAAGSDDNTPVAPQETASIRDDDGSDPADAEYESLAAEATAEDSEFHRRRTGSATADGVDGERMGDRGSAGVVDEAEGERKRKTMKNGQKGKARMNNESAAVEEEAGPWQDTTALDVHIEVETVGATGAPPIVEVADPTAERVSTPDRPPEPRYARWGLPDSDSPLINVDVDYDVFPPIITQHLEQLAEQTQNCAQSIERLGEAANLLLNTVHLNRSSHLGFLGYTCCTLLAAVYQRPGMSALSERLAAHLEQVAESTGSLRTGGDIDDPAQADKGLRAAADEVIRAQAGTKRRRDEM